MKMLTINKHNFLAVGGLAVLLLSMVMPAAAMAAAPAGASDTSPIALTIVPGQDVTRTGTLAPGQQVWYGITVNDVNGAYKNTGEDTGNGAPDNKDVPPLDLSLFVTPGDGNSIDHVQMTLYAGVQDVNSAVNFGAGSIVVPTGNNLADKRVGELTYSGWVENGQMSLIEIQNGNAYPVSYSLYTANMNNVSLGGAAQTAPAMAQTTASATGAAKLAAPAMPAGIDPNHPLALTIVPGQDVPEAGTLAAGQQVWYAINVDDITGAYSNTADEHGNGAPDNKDRPPLDLSLFVTPGNGNSIDNVQMNLFPGSYAQQWSQGHIWTLGLGNKAEENLANVAPFGAGSIVVPDHNLGDSSVGELTYSGWVMNGQTILIQIQNNNPYAISYHLYTVNMDNVSM